MLQDVDAALLPVISFPAFATHQDELVRQTKSNIIEKLKGKYGIKRFCRDGYKTLMEDPTRYEKVGNIYLGLKYKKKYFPS